MDVAPMIEEYLLLRSICWKIVRCNKCSKFMTCLLQILLQMSFLIPSSSKYSHELTITRATSYMICGKTSYKLGFGYGFMHLRTLCSINGKVAIIRGLLDKILKANKWAGEWKFCKSSCKFCDSFCILYNHL